MQVGGVRRQQVLCGDLARRRDRAGPVEQVLLGQRRAISPRPESCPTGAAPARHILMPLYCAGLWLAVNIAPGSSSEPEAK